MSIEKKIVICYILKLSFFCFLFSPKFTPTSRWNPIASIRETSTCFGRTQVVREFLEDFGEKTVVPNKRQRVAWSKKVFTRTPCHMRLCDAVCDAAAFFSEALEQSPSWALDPRTSPRDFEAWNTSFDQKNCKRAVWQVYVWPSGMDDPLEPQSRYWLFHRLGREWSTRSRYRFHVDCVLAYGVCSHKTYCRSRNPANVYRTYYIQHVYMYFTVYHIQYWYTCKYTNTIWPCTCLILTDDYTDYCL